MLVQQANAGILQSGFHFGVCQAGCGTCYAVYVRLVALLLQLANRCR